MFHDWNRHSYYVATLLTNETLFLNRLKKGKILNSTVFLMFVTPITFEWMKRFWLSHFNLVQFLKSVYFCLNLCYYKTWKNSVISLFNGLYSYNVAIHSRNKLTCTYFTNFIMVDKLLAKVDNVIGRNRLA